MQKVTIYSHYDYDSSYHNTRLFTSIAEQKEYFNDRVYTVLEGVNFIYNNLLETSFEFVFDNSSNISEILNCNYLSVDDEEREDITLYYYITDTTLNSMGEVTMFLKLDVMQTYLMHLQFDDAFINRGNVDRYDVHTINNDKYLTFKSNADSKFFKTEPLRFTTKYPVMRRELKPDYSTCPSEVAEFLKRAVRGWIRIFVKAQKYRISITEITAVTTASKSFENRFGTADEVNALGLNEDVAVLILPLVNVGYNITVNDTFEQADLHTGKWSHEYLQFILEALNPAYVFDIQLSTNSPLDYFNSIANYTISGNNLVLNVDPAVPGYSSTYKALSFNESTYNIFFLNAILDNYQEHYSASVKANANSEDIEFVPIINANEIMTNNVPQTRNPLHNPKLYNLQFSELVIDNLGNNTGIYNPLALNVNVMHNKTIDSLLNDKKLSVYANIINTLENSNSFVRVEGVENSLYNENTTNNVNSGGCVNNEILDIPFYVDKLQDYVANNKNWKAQALLQPIERASAGVATSTKPSEALTSIAGGVIGTVLAFVNTTLQEDNLSSAPGNVKNISNSPFFKHNVLALNPYATFYTLTPKERKELDDFNNYYGFTINEIDNPHKYFNNRLYHDYVKFIPTNFRLIINNEEKPLGELLKNEIRVILTEGIRLWHTDSIDFTKENPEISIFGGVTNGSNDN